MPEGYEAEEHNADGGAARERRAALVALMRAGGRAWASYVLAVRRAGQAQGVDPRHLLESELGLLAYQAQADAERQIDDWSRRGYRVMTMADPDYPVNLRVIEGRPPLLFVNGELLPEDNRSVAVIGTRNPTRAGRTVARLVAERLGAAGYTVVSGMAAGIDAEAHRASLAAGRRTLAVVGSGLAHPYPPEHAQLQQEIVDSGAVISQFWPEARPSRPSFPLRNAVMAGLTLASVIVEAGERSGTRTQARHALAQGRRVVLMASVLEQAWAQELAKTPGVEVAHEAAEVVDLVGQ